MPTLVYPYCSGTVSRETDAGIPLLLATPAHAATSQPFYQPQFMRHNFAADQFRPRKIPLSPSPLRKQLLDPQQQRDAQADARDRVKSAQDNLRRMIDIINQAKPCHDCF
jgi:hypothetical protein